MPQISLIKKHNLPRKFLKHYEIKVAISKKYCEQFNVTKFSIKNRLMEITKELKEFKFQQYLQIEFIKNIDFFGNNIFSNLWFRYEEIKFDDINIDELFYIRINQISLRGERWTHEESN